MKNKKVARRGELNQNLMVILKGAMACSDRRTARNPSEHTGTSIVTIAHILVSYTLYF